MYEKSSSTVEIPDIDINARFHLKSDWISVCTTNTSFLYEIKVNEGFKDKIDKMAKNDDLSHISRNIQNISPEIFKIFKKAFYNF